MRQTVMIAVGIALASAAISCNKKIEDVVGTVPGAFTSGMAASIVIGQTDFTSSSSGSAADKFNNPRDVALSSAGSLYVTLYNGNRVNGFTTAPVTSGASADFTIGSADVNTTGFGSSAADEMNAPNSASYYNGQLFIAQSGNNRVMIFNSPTTTGTSGNFAIGQSATNVGGAPGGASATTLNSPAGVSVANGKIAVADSSYNRVMLYNSIPTANGASAAVALGQTNKTSGASGSGAKFNTPLYVWTDGTKVVVSDNFNHRVLIWNTWPTADGQAPDLVLGQTNTSNHSANAGGSTNAMGFSQPAGIASDGTTLAIADVGNNRVLMWKTWPTTNGQEADLVFGQPDFVTGSSGVTASKMNNPNGVAMDSLRLFVADSTNNRVLVFVKQ